MKIREVKTPNKDYCFYDEDCIFCLEILKADDLVGTISIHKHPQDKTGGQLGLEIVEKWRKKWLSRNLAKYILEELQDTSKKHNLRILYTKVKNMLSPRLLNFFGFTEYYRQEPKTYYYLRIKGGI